VFQQASAAYLFTTVSDRATATAQIDQAFSLSQSPTFKREIALQHLFQINNLLAVTEPTPAQLQQLQQTITEGISAGRAAVGLDTTDARNYTVLGDFYAILAVINIEGAASLAEAAYAAAEKLDPNNPYYVLQKSAIAYRANDTDRARTLALQALALKSNYTDALLLLSQIDIVSGDVERAIATTQSLISLESNNPGRYYQLGVLYAAIENRPAAIEAFSAALDRDASHANARYMRALEYARDDEVALAISELQIVRNLSPDNGSVDEVIEQLRQGGLVQPVSADAVVSEPQSVSVENGVTTTTSSPETDVVVPVNGGRTSTPTDQAAQ
jgi:cytochrome c-type biogenesis protein CcmH/NrfG